MNTQQHKIDELISPVVEAMGFEYVGCEYLLQGHHAILRIFIDKPEGVTLDDCSQVSRQIGALLDVENPITTKYTLEVSSPGFDRPLFTLDHYKKFIGETVSIHLSKPINNRKNFKGIITKIEGEQIFLSIDNEEYQVPFSAVANANLERGS